MNSVLRFYYLVAYRVTSLGPYHLSVKDPQPHRQYVSLGHLKSLKLKVQNKAILSVAKHTLCSVQCTLYSVYCIVYTVHCTVYTIHCTVHSVYCIVCAPTHCASILKSTTAKRAS